MKWARHSQNDTIFSCPRNQLTKFVGFLSNYLHMLKSVIILLYFCFSLINAFIDMIVVEVKQGRMYNSIQTLIMSFISPPDTGRLFKIQMYFIYNLVHQNFRFCSFWGSQLVSKITNTLATDVCFRVHVQLSDYRRI